jgi:hypothetical protein
MNLLLSKIEKNKRFTTKAKPIIGTRIASPSNGNNNELQAGTRNAHIYVGRLHPDTSTSQVQDHMKFAANINHVDVQKLDSKSKFSAFKLTCDFSSMEKIMDTSVWPMGTYINRFYFKRGFQALNVSPPTH